MNNLTVEQTARVFAMYIGCDVSLGHGITKKLTGIESRDVYRNPFLYVRISEVSQQVHEPATCKLILRPLSAITDEDAIEVVKLYSPKSFGHETQREGSCMRVDYFDPTLDSFYIENDMSGVNYQVYQFLISKGYAVPLFIAPNHPDNGKTAIELGLAIESPTTN